MNQDVEPKIKTRIVKQKQKNGDIYILERKTQYDPVKKYNRVLSSRLVSKIPKGKDESVPTRPKRRNGEKVGNSSPGVQVIEATRTRIGMMDILEHIGNESGIDKALLSFADQGTAQKIISLARYLVGTNGQSFPGISVWQYAHPLPYKDGITEDIYHKLFEKIGRDEQLQQNFFLSRSQSVSDKPVLAYDSTTISTDSENLLEARYGFNKASDGKKTIKLLTLYSIDTMQPIAFTKQPGNLSDVVTVENALKQMDILGLGKAEIITDNGYYSESNLSEMLYAHFDFITLVKTSVKWIKSEIDAHHDDLETTFSVCPFDTATHGITIMKKHTFKHSRKYASSAKNMAAGSHEEFNRRIYIHIYSNPFRRVEQENELNASLFEIKAHIESGKAIEELSDNAIKKIEQFMHVHYYAGKPIVSFNEAAIAERKKYHGYFVLISSSEKDTFTCLSKYRRRGLIESFFESEKQRPDGNRPREWSSDVLRGRMFVQFVALCYFEYFHQKIVRLKSELGKPDGIPEHDCATNIAMEEKLKSWLCNTPLYLVLQWFDVIESVSISTQLKNKRWNTETTLRDKMFLEKIGMRES